MAAVTLLAFTLPPFRHGRPERKHVNLEQNSERLKLDVQRIVAVNNPADRRKVMPPELPIAVEKAK